MDNFQRIFAWIVLSLILSGYLGGIACAAWETFKPTQNPPGIASLLAGFISAVNGVLAVNFGTFLGFSLVRSGTYRLSRIIKWGSVEIAGDNDTRRRLQAVAASVYILGMLGAAISWFAFNFWRSEAGVVPTLVELSRTLIGVSVAFLSAYLIDTTKYITAKS